MQLHQERFAVRRDTISGEAVVCFPRLGWHVHSGRLPSRNTYENLYENVTDPVIEFCTPSLSVSRCLSAISSSLLRSCLDLHRWWISINYRLTTNHLLSSEITTPKPCSVQTVHDSWILWHTFTVLFKSINPMPQVTFKCTTVLE